MSQRNDKKEGILNRAPRWEQLTMDCFICKGCEKRCSVTSLTQPTSCLSSIREQGKEKATLKIVG